MYFFNGKKMNIKIVDNFNFKNKKAIVRVDFNVPLDEKFSVADDTRIKLALPTIQKILKSGGSVILMSHLGRPEAKEREYSLVHILRNLSNQLGIDVKFAKDCIGKEAQKLSDELKTGEVLLLENLRFYKEETAGDIRFAEQLSKLGDIYVNDAFGVAHRAHASTTVIANFFPNAKCFGYLLAKEIENINKVLKTGEKPITAILGGAKVSSKIAIIEKMLDTVDNIIIGGGMSYTFFKAQGDSIGDSLCEDNKMSLALEILDKAKAKNVNIYLPIDNLVADSFSNDANTRLVDRSDIKDGWQGLDVGPKTVEKFGEVVKKSKTILWNGPLGVFEFENFSKGTRGLGDYIYKATQNGAFSLVGGGDSVAAVKKYGYDTKVSYVSTGGGAMLESLEGKELPGVVAILND